MKRLTFLIALIAVPTIRADSLTLQQGVGQYGPCTWGTLYRAAQTSQDHGTSIDINNSSSVSSRFLLRFDSAAYPAALNGATIDSAFVRLVKYQGTTAISVTPYKILESWAYYSGGSNSPTWTRRDYNSGTPNLLWTNGGADTATSSSSTAAASTVSSTTTAATTLSWSITPSVVSGWVATPSTNLGLMFRAPENAGDQSAWFRSPSSTTTGEHPKLVIYYTTGNGGGVKKQFRRRAIVITNASSTGRQ